MAKVPSSNRFEFVVTAGARARQLLNGSVPRVETGAHKKTTIARQEVMTKAVQRIQPGEPASATAIVAPDETAD
jgi:DNA-directed RNA polymerase omega subunit